MERIQTTPTGKARGRCRTYVAAFLVGLLLLFSGQVPAPEDHACRFWALIGYDYPEDLIRTQLRDGSPTTLRELGGYNQDGWGVASFLAESNDPGLDGPLIRRGRPPADHATDTDFNRAVEEMANLKPKAAIGHVRKGSSGKWGIPNPHPFLHHGMLFAHNGTVPLNVLLELLLTDDAEYLSVHPTEYTSGYIDSELYFLSLLKYMRANRELDRTEALRRAVREVTLGAGSSRLNFIATAGDTLYALRFGPGDDSDPVRYHPRLDEGTASPYWVIASQPMGSSSGSWVAMPPRTLGVFVPGHAPSFYPVDPESLEVEIPEKAVGKAWPNPTPGDVSIEITSPSADAKVTAQVWDVQGRLVWEGAPTELHGKTSVLHWNGKDLRGASVPCGNYYCRVTIDGQSWMRTVSVVR
jgi:predicted glutamine amidotransferase